MSSFYHKHYTILPNDYFNAGSASSDIKKTLKQLKVSKEIIKKVSVASYEAEINVVIHSFGGSVDLHIVNHTLYLQFTDSGPGIENIELAMKPGYTTASEISRLNGFGAGMGLVNIKASADEMTLISDPNGTILKLKFFLHTEDANETI